jgi:hypothetical protein
MNLLQFIRIPMGHRKKNPGTVNSSICEKIGRGAAEFSNEAREALS